MMFSTRISSTTALSILSKRAVAAGTSTNVSSSMYGSSQYLLHHQRIVRRALIVNKGPPTTRPVPDHVAAKGAPPAFKRMLQRKRAAGAALSSSSENNTDSNNGPSLEMAKAMPLRYEEMDNTSLITLAASNNHDARIEVLKRHIMSIDNVNYNDACTKFDEIATANDKGMVWITLPYYTGIAIAVSAACGSIPLVFDLNTVETFNHYYVTTDVPEPQDLETWLEVGSWSWNWMEPPLGQISFFLLCLQYARAQMQNIGLRPYTRWIKRKRAERLANQFPMYDRRIVMSYSKTDSFVHGEV